MISSLRFRLVCVCVCHVAIFLMSLIRCDVLMIIKHTVLPNPIMTTYKVEGFSSFTNNPNDNITNLFSFLSCILHRLVGARIGMYLSTGPQISKQQKIHSTQNIRKFPLWI